MPSQLDATTDVPVATTDNGSSNTLMSEVNADRSAAKTADVKTADQGAESKVNSTFGSLTLVDDSKDSAAKATSDSSTATAPADSTRTTATADVTTASSGDAAAGATSNDKAAVVTTNDTVASTPTSDATSAAVTDVSMVTAAPDAPPAATTDATTNANPKPGDISDIPLPGPTGAIPDVANQPADKDIDAAALQKIHDDPKVKADKARLTDDITKQEKGLDPSKPEYQRLEQMKQDMETFEKRAAASHPPLGPEEVSKTYKNLSKLIEAKDGPKVQPKPDRLLAAQEAMLHAADPTTIDQGQYETCNVTTVETRMFAKDPAAATDLISQVATTGEYQLPGTKPGTPDSLIKINPESLKRQGESLDDHATNCDRSYASQIYQVTAINTYYQTHEVVKNGHTYPKGSLEYRQGDKDPLNTPPGNGELLIDTKTNQVLTDSAGKQVRCPDLDDSQIAQSYNQLTEHKDTGFFFANKDYCSGDGPEIVKIGSEAELKSKLQEAQANGKMPVILQVDVHQEPFFSESGGKVAGGDGGAHVVTVSGIDKDGNVTVDNQWGVDSKHTIPVHDLYVATMDPNKTLTDLKKECDQNAKDHAADPNVPIDFTKQAELLRMRRDYGDLKGSGNDAYYKQELLFLTHQAVKDASDHSNGQLDPHTEKELSYMLEKEFPRGGRDDVLTKAIGGNAAVGIFDGSGTVGKVQGNYDDQRMEAAADQLYNAGDQWYYNKEDYQHMYTALANKTPLEIQQMDADFKNAHGGKSMEQYINEKFKGHPQERDKALQLLHDAQAGTYHTAA
jgi:hypothetical protein